MGLDGEGEAVGMLWGGSGEASQPPGRLLLKAISMRFGGVLLEALGGVLGGSLGLLGSLEASWGPLWGILEALGGFLGVQEAKLEQNLVVGGFRFPGGPSWKRLGVVFWVLGGHFGFNFEAF